MRPKGKGAVLIHLLILQAVMDCPALSAPTVNGSRNEWNQSQASSSQHYGVVSSSIQRIEDALTNANQSLSQSEYYDFQSRLYSLKQSALLELSRGADASVLSSPIHSLEMELLSRIRENGLHSGARKTQLEQTVTRLEATFRSRRDELAPEDAAQFQERVNEIKKQSQESPANTDEVFCDKVAQEARELESKIMHKVMFGPRRYTLHVTKDEKIVSPEKSSESPASPDGGAALGEQTLPAGAEQSSTKGNAPATRTPPKPYVPIPKLIEQIEADLMDFHDKRQIGTFDMDSFSERLLAQKRNLKVMMSRTGRVSLRQEAVLRENLEQLHEDLINRISGRD